jgi:kumamolisin
MFQGVGFPALRILLVSALVSGAVIVSQAQQPSLLTRHVRQETLNGQAPLVGRLHATQSMRLVLVLPHRNEAELEAFLKELYDPSSASYRKFLTVEEFTAKFGPSQEDYDAAIRFAEANGLTVVGTSRNRMNLDVTGPVANIEAAFHVTMGTYQHPTESRTFFAPDREPTPDLEVQLWHIAGLDNYSTPKPNLVRSDARAAEAEPNAKAKPNATTGTGPSAAYLGSDMRAAYYVNGNASATLTGAGQSVGLFEFLGTDLADLATYYTNVGQTNNVPITLKSVDTQSTSCVERACDDTEQTLDMTQVLGMAPGLSSLVMYIGTGGLSGQTLDDAGILNAMATASPLNAQLSSAWTWKPTDPTTDDVYFEEFAAQGQNFFVADGDDGNWSHAPFVWPADSVYVTSVGGTDLTTTGADGAWASETGWVDSGGGIAPDYFPIPSWQVATAAGCAECSQTFRNGPDVAANANFTYYVCADQEACTANLYGGTSFAVSMWAGYMALVNQQAVLNGNPVLGFINPALYTIGLGVDYDTDFHDTTSGGNTLGSTVGYDLSTGWGSPNGNALINALAGALNPTFYISSSPSLVSVAQGMSGTTTITTTHAGGFNSSVALSATGQPTGVTPSFSPTSFSAPGSGTSTLTLTVASTTATGTYPITVEGTGGSLTLTTTVTLTVIAAGQVAVPNVVGETQADATTAIEGAGLVLGTVTTASSSAVPLGDVISESPSAGAGVISGSVVDIVVSSGPTPPAPAATPVFSPAAGTYSYPQSVNISDSTNGATIYYTTDGTTPTTSSPVYSGAIRVSATQTLEAIATASGFSQSATAVASYTIGAPGSGEWTWMSGSNTFGGVGVYGTPGTPAAGNTPGDRSSASTWTDSNGHLWLFGGSGFNDLWEFNPSLGAHGEWAWMGGSNATGSVGVYGTPWTPAAVNIPGGRSGAASWTDSGGHFWLFGGAGTDAGGSAGLLNDLWEFNPSLGTNGEWAWMGGSSTVGSNGGQSGVYGTPGTAAAGNIPGGRSGAVSWTDSSGNLWLFGGNGLGAIGADGEGPLNDLWEFNPSLGAHGEWAWMGGSNATYSLGAYGTPGTPAAGNIPGGRSGAVSWTDSSGKFWLFGGNGVDSVGNMDNLNDLWEFNPSLGAHGEWTWMSGSNTVDNPGVYGCDYAEYCPLSANVPGSRTAASGWKDATGNLWLFGGNGEDGAGVFGVLNDLWEFSPSTSLWTWMGGVRALVCVGSGGGSSVCEPPAGVYGTLGTAAAANFPEGRYGAVSWTVSGGNFWLFGGFGENTPDNFGGLNDLWSFQPPAPGPTAAATPTFSLASGTYSTAQIVTISDATAGAAIYYSTNGYEPTTSSTLYSGAINVSATEVVEAIAVASGYANSQVAEETYTIQTNVPTQVNVPNVVGDTQAAATTAITAAQLVVGTVTPVSSSTVASGNVISESPIAGTSVSSGSAVNLVVSTGAAPVAVPNVVGDTQAAASTAITGAGLVVGTVTMASSPTVASGNVISESPIAGTSVSSGSAVNLVVSTGAAPAPGYTLSANPSSLTIPSGSTGSTVITLTPVDGFTGTVNFACGTLPSLVTCTFAPTSLTVPSSSPLTTTLTIGTTGTTTASLGDGPAGGVLPEIFAALILLPLGFTRRILRTRKAGSRWLACLLLLAGATFAAAGMLGIAGCGGSGKKSTPAGTYSIPITVTSGGTTVPLNLSITIQ